MAPSSANPSPTVIELQRPERRLRVEWDDGHESSYSVRYLRGFCPCAQCQGHAQNQWSFVAVENPEITRIDETGSYAVTIAFSDGHDTGIYSWETLRELCPCDTCQALLAERHAVRQLPAGESV